LVRGHSVAGLLPVNILEPDDIELPLIHYNSKDYKQAIRDIFTGHFIKCVSISNWNYDSYFFIPVS
jgi:hypothetical protein